MKVVLIQLNCKIEPACFPGEHAHQTWRWTKTSRKHNGQEQTFIEGSGKLLYLWPLSKSTLAKKDAYQRYLNLNTQEEYPDLLIYGNICKDYNEKIHKLDMHISKSETENELQEQSPTFISSQRHGKDIIRWGEAKRFLGCEISRGKSIIHSTDIYLVPTISTRERCSGEQTIQGLCHHGNCMFVKKVQQWSGT